MNPKILIALHGAQGSGKDTVADLLVKHHGFTKIAFADQLREMTLALNPVVTYEVDHRLIAEVNGWQPGAQTNPTIKVVRLADVVERYGWDQAKRQYPEVRRTLQRLATEVIRDFVRASYFADIVVNRIQQHERVVIPDLRFEQEYEAILPFEPTVWWVERPDNPYATQDPTHRSETWHPPVDERVVNRGNLAALTHDVVNVWFPQQVRDRKVAR